LLKTKGLAEEVLRTKGMADGDFGVSDNLQVHFVELYA
jgi:hypothetical protein